EEGRRHDPGATRGGDAPRNPVANGGGAPRRQASQAPVGGEPAGRWRDEDEDEGESRDVGRQGRGAAEEARLESAADQIDARAPESARGRVVRRGGCRGAGPCRGDRAAERA